MDLDDAEEDALSADEYTLASVIFFTSLMNHINPLLLKPVHSHTWSSLFPTCIMF